MIVLRRIFYDLFITFFRSVFMDTLNLRKKNGNRRCDLIDLINDLEKKGSLSTATAKKEDESVLKLEGDDLLAQVRPN